MSHCPRGGGSGSRQSTRSRRHPRLLRIQEALHRWARALQVSQALDSPGDGPGPLGFLVLFGINKDTGVMRDSCYSFQQQAQKSREKETQFGQLLQMWHLVLSK